MAAVAVWGIGAIGAESVPGRYVWPLSDQTKVTAGFCDWRPGHYHGGIDITTGGTEGLDVRAADSGWVMRLSTSYWGYGKAVYLQMHDGRIAVYGHLSEFAPAIQKYVEQEQYASRRYGQNLFPAPGELPIGRGDVIAKTGQTGGGPPHLHFEIRTGQNRPLNPLVFGFEKPDAVAPTIKAVTIVPRPPIRPKDRPVSINGGWMPVTITMEGPADSRRLTETPVVTGAVGLSILVEDGIDGDRYVLSPYRLRAWVNDQPVAQVTYDSINYSHTHLIDLERRIDPRPGLAPRSVNLFRRVHNVLWHYTDMVNEGWLVPGETLIPGANIVRVEASDIAGNTSSAEFGLMLVEKSPAPDPTRTGNLPTEVTYQASEGGLVVFFPQTSGDGPARCCRDSECADPLYSIPVPGGVATWLSPDEGLDAIWVSYGDSTPTEHALPWTSVRREEGGTVVSAAGDASVTIGPDDLFRHTYMALTVAPAPSHPPQPLSLLYEFAPFDAAFARAVRLAIAQPVNSPDPAKVGVYRFRGPARGWDFEGAGRDSARGVVT
ncbi:MAG TPA: M23 family metallopeptidase, partial [Acidobacteriota bacterium]|nr:M23 family metallopeptidase [Acidobacteriota bacterium]